MTNPAAATALGPMVIVATEQYLPAADRLLDDPLAAQMLTGSGRAFVNLARWRPVREALIGLSEMSAPGITGSVLCRKRYVADRLAQALPSADAVVILGAGLDTTGARITERSAVPVFEVDLPENIAAKEARLQAVLGRIPESLHLVSVDFERQSLEGELRAAGLRPEGRIFYVWEAVTQYLEVEAVRATLAFMQKAAPGSGLVFTFVRQDFMDGTNRYGAENLYQNFRVKQRLWRFGLSPEQVAPFLAEFGWREVEQMGPEAFTRRYLTPVGRVLKVSGLERSVYAERS